MADAFLQVRGVRKAFGGVEVLHGVDLDAASSSVIALLGENGAGKSTLMRIVAGDLRPDSGEIRVGGELAEIHDVASARRLGIRLIHQEIAYAPMLSVAENIALGEWPHTAGFVRRREMRDRARRLLASLDADIDVERPVADLPLGEQQIVEITRALAGEARCLILDEPTAALSDAETARLFDLIHGLRDRGVAIVHITHRLDEIARIADRVCVLRDGRVVLDDGVASASRAAVVEAMVGHAVHGREGREPRPPASSRPVLELRNGSSAPAFADVSVAVRAGEVRAIYGKVGSGATEVAQSLFGVRKLDAGEVAVDGWPLRLRHPADAIAAGIGFLPPDRHREALLRVRSVAENLAAPSWRSLAWLRTVLSARREDEAYWRWHGTLKIRSRNDPAQQIWSLSGGNQQKVILGRWLERASRALVLVEPTRGVDVAARQEIYRAIEGVAARDTAVLIATSDYEDVTEVADYATVMARGSIVAEFRSEAIRVNALTDAAGGEDVG